MELAKSAQQTNQEVSRASCVAAEPPTKKMRTGLFSHYRTTTASQSPSATCLSTASQQLINSEAFDPGAESSRLDRLALDYPLLQPLFSRMFCVLASSAPVERIFSQSGIGLIMSARRAHMSNAVLEINMSNVVLDTLVFLKCNCHL